MLHLPVKVKDGEYAGRPKLAMFLRLTFAASAAPAAAPSSRESLLMLMLTISLKSGMRFPDAAQPQCSQPSWVPPRFWKSQYCRQHLRLVTMSS